MRLREYFYDKEGETTEEEKKPWEKKESNFTPKPGRNKWLDIEEVKDGVIKGVRHKVEPNLSKTEQRALKDLLSDASIVIRPADKGSGIVVIDTEEYVKKIETEVSNDRTYIPTEGDGLTNAEKRVKKVANKMEKDGTIDPGMRKYLVPKYTRNGKLKGNPKLHKDHKPYRAIVNNIGTPTEKMAEIAEKELNEYVKSTPSYLKDTTDFLCKLKEVNEPLPKDSILFCFDVVKL